MEPLSNVRVEVRQTGEVYQSYTTLSPGKYQFSLPLDPVYEIHFIKEGYVTKSVEFDTRGIPASDKLGGFRSNMDMTLFEPKKGGDYRVLMQPIGKAAFIPMENSIAFDFDYTARRMELLERANKYLED